MICLKCQKFKEFTRDNLFLKKFDENHPRASLQSTIGEQVYNN
jgi:hypothetical protein